MENAGSTWVTGCTESIICNLFKVSLGIKNKVEMCQD